MSTVAKKSASGKKAGKKNRVDHPISGPSLKRMANIAGATSIKTDVLPDARVCMALHLENFLAHALMFTQSRGANTVQSGDIEGAARVLGLPRLYGSHIDSKRTFGSSFGKKKKPVVKEGGEEASGGKQKKRAAEEEEAAPRKKKTGKSKKAAAADSD